MTQKITIPHNWQIPESIDSRIAEVPGTQRALEGEEHLVLILHKLPKPGHAERELTLFWRTPEGTWASSDGGAGIGTLQGHVAKFNDCVLELERDEEHANTADEYFHIRRQITPIHRAAQNMSATIHRAHELAPADRGLLACRNLAASVQRTSELLKDDATYGLEYAMAKQTESQALAAHRLNLIAAIFFPILAFASIFGMNLTHGFEHEGEPWLFWLMVALGITIGMGMKSVVFSTKLR